MNEFISVNELSRRAGITRQTLHKFLEKGQGPRVTRLPSGRVRIKLADAELWLGLMSDVDKVSRQLLGWS